VWTPGSYEIDDLGDLIAKLTSAGARPDKNLLWDLAVTDVRAAADALRGAYSLSATLDGYVCVWIEPGRANDPAKAVAAAAEIVGDVRRANVAVGMAWTPQRAAALEALIKSDCPVALGGVRDQAAVDAVAAARSSGMAKRRADLTSGNTGDDPEAVVPEVPVFLLSSDATADHVFGVPLVTEFDLFDARGPVARVPLTPDAEQTGMNVALDRLAQRAKLPPRDDAYSPDTFERGVLIECNELHTDEVLEDVWSRDHTIWKDDPAEIADRLGWLDVAERMSGEAKDITEFARKARASSDVKHVLVLGMGGSVLAAETFWTALSGGVPLTVLDTTHPDHIASVRDSLDLQKTLFVVGSKSGSTIETRAHLEYFWSLVGRGDRFVAITDPGSELASVARDRGFARVFENAPDIGGRYSALSYFGLVPAALGGVDIEPVLASARRAMAANSPGAGGFDAPALRLGAALGEAARKDSRDKLTLVIPKQLGTFGAWIEQLIAESTGKEDVGMLPVVGEPLGSPDVYGADRLFCVYTTGEDAPPPQLEALEDHPVIRLRVPDARTMGAEMYRWEMATAILGYLLDINPFDQPDVEAAKVRAREALTGSSGAVDPGDARSLLGGLAPPHYIALQAFLPPSGENARRLEAVRLKLRDTYKVAVTVGFGPRFLHSTGQYHKGGPNTGVFLQVTGERTTDIEIPGMGFTFGKLIDAQADGDLLALREKGRKAARLSLTELESLI
jgi:glucose-6-phosphate isomerase